MWGNNCRFKGRENKMNNRKRNILKAMKLYYDPIDFGRGKWYIKKNDVTRKIVFEVYDCFMEKVK